MNPPAELLVTEDISDVLFMLVDLWTSPILPDFKLSPGIK
jgi:hypothetical protein